MVARCAAILFALSALTYSATGLLAQAYSAYANTVLALRSDHKAGLVAARYAARLAPLDAALQSQFAWMLYRNGQVGEAKQEMKAALRQAPADADLWLRWSVVQLGCQDCYADLAHAADRVNVLAPRQMGVQQRQATLALAQWPYGDSATHSAWLKSLNTAIVDSPTTFIGSLKPAEVSVAACVDLLAQQPMLHKVCHESR